MSAMENDIDFKARVIRISEEITSATFDKVDRALSIMEKQKGKGITIRIRSDGGSVHDALAVVARIRQSPCEIHTEGYGAIQSAATLILISGDYRRLSKYAQFMVHESHVETSGRLSNIKSEMVQQVRLETIWAQAMEEFSKKDANFWLNCGVGVDCYLTPKQLCEYGAVDEIF